MSRDWLDKNFYATLGVPQNATKEEIKKARRGEDSAAEMAPDIAKKRWEDYDADI